MPASIRPATRADLPGMTDLLIRDAEQRRALNPSLWALAADARARIEAALGRSLDGATASTQEQWLLAETRWRLVGVAHAMLVPVPPIFGVKTGPPGLFLDDCFTAEDAPRGTAEALLAATEDALRGAGASTFIASCPAAGPWRPLFARHGYEPVTLYMGKHGFSGHAPRLVARPAGQGDIPGIVSLSADHRKTLARLNPRFWPLHPDADSRFEGWMRYSLTLADRDMIVAGPPGEVHGYVISQPIAPLLVPVAHGIGAIGVIDDFYDRDFANVAAVSGGGVAAAGLLSAAEAAFARRAVSAALAVCPAAWTSKVRLLERAGYRTAKLWMLKR